MAPEKRQKHTPSKKNDSQNGKKAKTQEKAQIAEERLRIRPVWNAVH